MAFLEKLQHSITSARIVNFFMLADGSVTYGYNPGEENKIYEWDLTKSVCTRAGLSRS